MARFAKGAKNIAHAGDRRGQADRHAVPDGPPHQVAGIGRPGQRSSQVLEPEPRVVAVPGHPAGLDLAVDDQDRPHPGDSQFTSGGQARRSGPDHQDGGIAHRGTRVNEPGSLPVSSATRATTSAPQ